MFTEAHCIVEGRVQGVFYRDFVQNTAVKHGLTGWTKNLPEGQVEIVAQGTPDDLKLFVEKLHEGSSSAHVESVSVDWRTPTEHFDDFVVIYS